LARKRADRAERIKTAASKRGVPHQSPIEVWRAEKVDAA
jgi:hypothetical protein